MGAERTPEIPAGDIERYHVAAVELADEARRIVAPALERGFTVERKPDQSLVTDMHNRLWDQAPSQVLVEEAGGRYVVVRDFPAPDGGRILSAVFGQPAVVDRLVTLFQEGRLRTPELG